ncbi:MAG: nitrilase-related carbon-nitrogen hydrolase [Bacteroidales bacterium]|nr:nitrilase-related carbon-nitrogen hydrolase [Bacteroidales bacterium]
MFSRNVTVSLIEDNIIPADKSANLAQLRRNMQNVPDDTDLVVLPELFTTGFVADREQALELAERNIDDTIACIHQLAQEHQCAIAGSFLAHTAGQLFNRAFFIEPSGEETFYDKRHLFTFGGEDKIYKQGHKAAPIIRFRGFNIKMIVCYDLRFPVYCRNVKNNYDVLLVVANWPKARESAWSQLLYARAVENEAYVLGLNRCGTDADGLEFSEGSSLIIDFKGKLITERGTSPVIAAELSLPALQRFREKFPAWQDADEFTIK